jgi:soluble lytic murein transglycosylase-like protein
VSVDAVLSRVAELQAMLAGAAPSATGGTAAPAPTSSSSFADQLAGASTASIASDGSDGSTSDLMSTVGLGAAPAAAGTSSLPASVPYAAQITASARRNGIDPALLAGLIKQESGFNANARSGAGAEGLTQLMPGTASGLGVTNPLDPAQSIEGGARYLKAQLDRFGGDTARALAAYNAGPGAVERFGGVPPYAETQNYVRAVQANAAAFGAGTAVPA